MWAIMVVLQLMFPRDSRSNMVNLLSLVRCSHNITIPIKRYLNGTCGIAFQNAFVEVRRTLQRHRTLWLLR